MRIHVLKILWIVVPLIAILSLAVFFIDEPLRTYAEREFNRHLDGYTLTLEALHFHLFGLSVDFVNAKLVQNAQVDPPVALIPNWHASVHWKALLHGRLVSDHRIDRPTVHVTRTQVQEERKDDESLEDRGWQEALLSVYPLKIDVLTIVDGDITYLDNPRSNPLHMDQINLTARNIRNVHSRDRTYPSTLHVEARALESGRLLMDGTANFLSEPHPGINVDLVLEQMKLDDVVPVTGRVNVQLRRGLLSARGHVEYSPLVKEAIFRDLLLEGVRLDYVHAATTQKAEKQVAATTAQAAEQLSNHPVWLVQIAHAKILDSEVGFVNEAVTPPYRVFLTDANIGLENFSNQLSKGTAYIKMTGKFMGTGLTQASATFRPERDAPDFDLQVRMVKTKMRSLNDVLRAYGNFDVTEGVFSFFTQLTIKDGTITGYVKPLFKDVDVYDAEQDHDKRLLQKMYEGTVGGAMTVLENAPRNEIATKGQVSGPVKNPRISTWQVVLNLVRNAFFKAILPGFEKEVERRD